MVVILPVRLDSRANFTPLQAMSNKLVIRGVQDTRDAQRFGVLIFELGFQHYLSYAIDISVTSALEYIQCRTF
jgi:hypothetical protein